MSDVRRINAAGLALIKEFEGLHLKAYLDPIGIWTIGYGVIKGVHEGMEISTEDAERLLIEELKEKEAGVEGLVKIRLNDNQFSALVSFAYNLGLQNLGRSTLLRMVNLCSFAEASDEFPKWNKAGGKVLAGLTRRRVAERALFLSPVV